MRMFLYYSLHSFINQIKKMFKTWVMVFIVVCFVIGGAIGLFAATISDLAEKNKGDEEIVEVVETQEEEPEEERVDTIRDVIGVNNLLELLAGAIIILMWSLSTVNAVKSGGKIFLPADVNLLFPSPLKPQSVMLFRIGTQIGVMLFMGVYMLFQLPNLVINLGMSVFAGVATIIAFSIVTFLGTLMQLLVYLLASKYDTVKKMVRPTLTAVLALAAGGYFMYQRNSGLGYLEAACNFFNAKGTQFIPFWGWMKGFVRTAADGNVTMMVLFLVLTIVGAALMIWFMWKLKVDFYEDAMAKSEEVAAAIEAMKESNTGLMKRKKDRSDKLLRDGFSKGSGANVYFFKNMYNRKRFAHFGFFTKTMEFYLFVAVAAACVCRFSIETTEVMWLAGVFAVITFMRSLGNKLEEDTKMAYFVMIPESAFSKMFYSYLAEFVGSAIDLAIPMVVGALVMGGNPFYALAWTLALLSINAYSSSVGTFIGLTVPNNAGVQIKQLVQVMFVYFGLLPDIVVLSVCAVLGKLALGVALAVAVNLLLGLLFFFLAAQVLEPHGGSVREEII